MRLEPAAVSLEACSYSLAGLASGSGGADHNPSMCPSPCVRAGDPLLLAVATHDRYGNAVAVAPGAIMAAANGPKGAVPFTPVAAPCRRKQCSWLFARGPASPATARAVVSSALI